MGLVLLSRIPDLSLGDVLDSVHVPGDLSPACAVGPAWLWAVPTEGLLDEPPLCLSLNLAYCITLCVLFVSSVKPRIS